MEFFAIYDRFTRQKERRKKNNIKLLISNKLALVNAWISYLWSMGEVCTGGSLLGEYGLRYALHMFSLRFNRMIY